MRGGSAILTLGALDEVPGRQSVVVVQLSVLLWLKALAEALELVGIAALEWDEPPQIAPSFRRPHVRSCGSAA